MAVRRERRTNGFGWGELVAALEDATSNRHQHARAEIQKRRGNHFRLFLQSLGVADRNEQTRLIHEALNRVVLAPRLASLRLNGTTEEAVNEIDRAFEILFDELLLASKDKPGGTNKPGGTTTPGVWKRISETAGAFLKGWFGTS